MSPAYFRCRFRHAFADACTMPPPRAELLPYAMPCHTDDADFIVATMPCALLRHADYYALLRHLMLLMLLLFAATLHFATPLFLYSHYGCHIIFRLCCRLCHFIYAAALRAV